ncbi:MAG: hypothetical protein ACXWM1_05020 [Candidatus Binataceae bacterium]
MTNVLGKSRPAWPQWPRWLCAMVAAALIGLAAAAEFAMGRKLWGLSGEPGI